MKNFVIKIQVTWVLCLILSLAAFSQDQGYIQTASNALKAKDYQKAIENYTKAIEKKSNYAPSYYGRGLAYYYMDKYDLALDDFARAISYDAKYHQAFYSAGLCYTKLGKYSNAINNLEGAIELFGSSPDYYYALGNAYQFDEKYEKALASYSKAIEINPNYGLAFYGRGVMNKQLGNLNPAIEDLEKYIYLQENKDGLEQEARRLINDINEEKMKK